MLSLIVTVAGLIITQFEDFNSLRCSDQFGPQKKSIGFIYPNRFVNVFVCIVGDKRQERNREVL